MDKKSIKRILVPIDGSKSSFSAASHAIEIAKNFHATIFVIHAFERPSPLLDVFSPIGSVPLYLDPKAGSFLREDIERKVEVWFQNIEKIAKKQRVTIKNEVLFRSTAVEESILSYAKDNRIDLIVMGTRGIGGFKKLLMGSVSKNIVEHAHCAVLLVK